MKPSFVASRETNAILAAIRSMSIGQDMSFDSLSRLVGFEVTSTSQAYQSARRAALRDDGIVTDSIRSFGFRRLSGGETVGKSDRHMKSIRRRARFASKELGAAMRQNLTTAEMIEATKKQGALGVILLNAAPTRSNHEPVGAGSVVVPPRANLATIPK